MYINISGSVVVTFIVMEAGIKKGFGYVIYELTGNLKSVVIGSESYKFVISGLPVSQKFNDCVQVKIGNIA